MLTCLFSPSKTCGLTHKVNGVLLQELAVYISHPQGQNFMTFTVEMYRFYSALMQPLLWWLWNSPFWHYSTCSVEGELWNIINFERPIHPCEVACKNVSTAWIAKNSPLLFPSGPLRMVHSSMLPKDSKRRRTSSSDCCLLSMPTKSFLSSKRKWHRSRSEDQKCSLK